MIRIQTLPFNILRLFNSNCHSINKHVQQESVSWNLKKHEATYRDFPSDKGGDVFIVVKDRDSLQKVGLQPVPVLCDLLPR